MTRNVHWFPFYSRGISCKYFRWFSLRECRQRSSHNMHTFCQIKIDIGSYFSRTYLHWCLWERRQIGKNEVIDFLILGNSSNSYQITDAVLHI